MTTKVLPLAAIGLALVGCTSSERQVETRQYSGVWLHEFEGSTFIEGATEVPRTRIDYEKASWLSYDLKKLPSAKIDEGYLEPINCFLTTPYHLTFLGHKITSANGSGHMGLWPSEIVVDRMIVAKPLGSPFCYDR